MFFCVVFSPAERGGAEPAREPRQLRVTPKKERGKKKKKSVWMGGGGCVTKKADRWKSPHTRRDETNDGLRANGAASLATKAGSGTLLRGGSLRTTWQ